MMNESLSFPLGQVVLTQGVQSLLERVTDRVNVDIELTQIIRRFASSDWGNIDEHDADMNQDALAYLTANPDAHTRVMGVYTIGGEVTWVITDFGDGQAVTTLLLPSEY